VPIGFVSSAKTSPSSRGQRDIIWHQTQSNNLYTIILIRLMSRIRRPLVPDRSVIDSISRVQSWVGGGGWRWYICAVGWREQYQGKAMLSWAEAGAESSPFANICRHIAAAAAASSNKLNDDGVCGSHETVYECLTTARFSAVTRIRPPRTSLSLSLSLLKPLSVRVTSHWHGVQYRDGTRGISNPKWLVSIAQL